ncbi:MAG: hypothetical protein HYV02_01315 [Deltaproteobacteria bacterium]|nr:hypothetical protein [Deltaproteobacteria bacterium]
MGPEILRKLEEAFAWGATDREACFYAEIAPSTLYRFQQENGEFLDRKRRFQLRPILKARVAVVVGILRDPYLALKFLEKKLPAEFGKGR